MVLRNEIHQQPDVLAGLLDSQMAHVQIIARAIRAYNPAYAFLAARGTSDHAGLYAKYLWGAFNRLPVALAAPSLFTLYEAAPRLDRALVIGVSQSGQSPDIVRVIEEGRGQGALTLAVTNAPESPLAQAAQFVLDVRAGEERAVAATKTYTAELMSLAMLSVAMEDAGDQRLEMLRGVPDAVREALLEEDVIEQSAQRYRYMTRCVVLGRGYNYATAFEWSLKLKELTYLIAEPYSTADFQHGPIAMVERGFPILAIAPKGAVYGPLLDLLTELRDEKLAELLVISNGEEALATAHTAFRLPGNLPEWVTPMVSIVLGQLFCYHLTRAKGFDVDAPRGLTKVTHTL